MGFRMVLDAQEGIEVVGEAADGRMVTEMCLPWRRMWC
jgi:hypothetical protein